MLLAASSPDTREDLRQRLEKALAAIGFRHVDKALPSAMSRQAHALFHGVFAVVRAKCMDVSSWWRPIRVERCAQARPLTLASALDQELAFPVLEFHGLSFH